MHIRINHFIVFVVFVVIAIFITYPLIFHLGTMTTGAGDELLLSWIQSWVTHSLLTDPLHLFSAPNFYPYIDSLAYSDILVTSSVLLLFPALLVGQPIAFQNVGLLVSLTLLGFSTYLLSSYMSKDYLLSFISGMLVIFSPVILDKYVHLQILFIFFVPLSIYFFLVYLETKRVRYFLFCMMCFVLQTLNSFLPGYFILFSLFSIAIVYYLKNKNTLKLYVNKRTVSIFVLSLLFIIPFVIPYYHVAKEFNYSRDIRDAINLAVQPEDLLYSYEFTRLTPLFNWIFHPQTYPSSVLFKNGWPGLVFMTLTVVTLLSLRKTWKKLESNTLAFLLISAVGLTLSLGPFLHINRHTVHHPFPIPLPYALFYYILPGFNGMRNSARWEVLFIIAFSTVITIGLKRTFKTSILKKRLLCAALILGILLEFKQTIPFTTISQRKDFPPEYSWLNKTPKESIVIEMPIYNWNTFPYANEEILRQYYMTANFRRSVNGFSGFSPPPWQVLVSETLSYFPQKRSIDKLKSLKVNYILVHLDDYDRLNKDNFLLSYGRAPNAHSLMKMLELSKQVKIVKTFPKTVIYKII